MSKTKRIYIRLSDEERDLILRKMKLCKTENISAYMLKMAIDGMVINLDISELKEIVSLLRYSGNNINQIAKRLNERGNIYSSDIQEIKTKQDEIFKMVREIYLKLSKI